MSEIKVNKISPRTACGTTQLGDSGDTFTLPSGGTMTVASGATITNSGTASGFGATGAVSWDVASIKTTGFTATTGIGYFCNTTSGGFTVTLPGSPSAGDVVGVSDYAQTWDTGNLTLGRNSEKIGGNALDAVISTEGLAVTLVYVDSTKGWIVTDSGLQSDAPTPLYVASSVSGACNAITTSGDYKIATFKSPGTFTITCAGNAAGSNTVDYLVVAGGGGGGVGPSSANYGSGSGAGGYRESSGAASGCYTISPLGACVAALPVTATGYPITVGGGGAGGGPPSAKGTSGTSSSFVGSSTITSAGGGGGASNGFCSGVGQPGGSGGGAAGGVSGPNNVAGVGNTPTVSPPQGEPGGVGAGTANAGGGGGATAAGTAGTGPAGGPGGAGATSSIDATPTIRAGGGGGNGSPTDGTGGPGGGGGSGTNGTQYTGGGGGGSHTGYTSGSGGDGIVIIRYKFQ